MYFSAVCYLYLINDLMTSAIILVGTIEVTVQPIKIRKELCSDCVLLLFKVKLDNFLA